MTEEQAQQRLAELRRPLSDAEIAALAALIQAHAAEVNAANDNRKQLGYALAYDGCWCDEETLLRCALKNRGVLP